MNVTDEGTETPSYNSQLASTIRLAPQFVNRLCSRLETAEAKPDGVSGLLFGTSQEELIVVQAFRSLMDSETAAIDAGQLTLDDAIRELAKSAERDPGLAPLDVIGWFAFRSVGGLHDADVAFHNRQFGSATDVALIIRRVDGGQLLFEFYTRLEKELLTGVQHRWGASRFSPSQVIVGPVEIALRARAKGAASEPAKPQPASAPPVQTGRTSRFSILKSSEKSAGAASQTSKPKRRLITTGDLASVPAVIPKPKRSGVPWLSSAILFLIFAGGTFALLLARGISSSNSNSLWRTLLPDTGLNLRVEGQGDRVLLSWNRRNSVVRSAAGAVLHIDDGPQHRDVHLDPSQVENGAVLYRPNSDDVSFRLDVHGQDGRAIAENLRVLDSAHANTQPLDVSNADGTPAASETAMNPPITTEHVHVWQPAPVKSQVLVPPPAKPAPTLEAPRPSSQRFDISRLTAPAIPNANTPAPTIPSAASPNGSSSAPLQTAPSEPAERTLEPAASQQTTPRNTELSSARESSAPQNAEVRQTGSPSQILPPAAAPTSKPPAANAPSELTATKPAPTQPAAQPQPSLALRYVAPRPIRQVLPDISSLPASIIASTSQIDVIVTVDKNGHVTKAEVQQQGRRRANRSMVIAAENAARQWIFEPARIDGHPVLSEHSIIFQFGSR